MRTSRHLVLVMWLATPLHHVCESPTAHLTLLLGLLVVWLRWIRTLAQLLVRVLSIHAYCFGSGTALGRERAESARRQRSLLRLSSSAPVVSPLVRHRVSSGVRTRRCLQLKKVTLWKRSVHFLGREVAETSPCDSK